MLSKSKAKFIRSLQLRKYRQKYHKIVVEGVKIINDLLTEGLAPVDSVYATEQWLRDNGALIPDTVEAVEVTERELKTITGLSTPNEVLAVVDMPDHDISPAAATSRLCLYLDEVRDPGNLGTLFRTADWFGINEIFLSPGCVDPYNSKVMQSSMSSIFRVKWTVVESVQLFEGISCYAAVMDGTPVTEIGRRDRGILVLGNESRGVGEDILSLDPQLVTITGARRLGAESLNVAVAGGILMSVLCGQA